MQDALIAQGLLESRGIPHPASVSKDAFVTNYPDTVARTQSLRGNPQPHKLKSEWLEILGKKRWATVSETTLRKDIAAWTWLQTCRHESLENALFSKLALCEMLLHRIPDDRFFLCLGHATWAALCWPVVLVAQPADALAQTQGIFRLDSKGAVEFIHITDPTSWEEVPFDTARSAGVHGAGLLLMQRRPARGLVRARLDRLQSKLDFEDLQRVARHLGLGLFGRREQLLRAICDKVSEGDEGWVKQVLDCDTKSTPNSVELLLNDPTFEAAYDELPDEDKEDFPEIRDVLKKKKARQRAADNRVEAVKRKRSPDNRSRRTRRQNHSAIPKAALPSSGPADALAPPQGVASASAVAPMAAHSNASSSESIQSVATASVAASSAAASSQLAPHLAAPVSALASTGAVRAKARPRVRNPDTVGVPWGRWFTIARTRRFGELTAMTVTCKFHRLEGRCNQWLSLGDSMSEADAEHRIKEWCVRGLDIPDEAGARARHMDIKARRFKDDEIRSIAVLDAIANH